MFSKIKNKSFSSVSGIKYNFEASAALHWSAAIHGISVTLRSKPIWLSSKVNCKQAAQITSFEAIRCLVWLIFIESTIVYILMYIHSSSFLFRYNILLWKCCCNMWIKIIINGTSWVHSSRSLRFFLTKLDVSPSWSTIFSSAIHWRKLKKNLLISSFTFQIVKLLGNIEIVFMRLTTKNMTKLVFEWSRNDIN